MSCESRRVCSPPDTRTCETRRTAPSCTGCPCRGCAAFCWARAFAGSGRTCHLRGPAATRRRLTRALNFSGMAVARWGRCESPRTSTSSPKSPAILKLRGDGKKRPRGIARRQRAIHQTESSRNPGGCRATSPLPQHVRRGGTTRASDGEWLSRGSWERTSQLPRGHANAKAHACVCGPPRRSSARAGATVIRGWATGPLLSIVPGERKWEKNDPDTTLWDLRRHVTSPRRRPRVDGPVMHPN